MKKLLHLIAFIVMLPLLADGQGTCPIMTQRNNGQGNPGNCPGAGTLAEATLIVGTPYAYNACCSSLTKTGNFDLKWTSTTVPGYTPVVKNVRINGTVSTTSKFGPPSAIVSSGTDRSLTYCFYGYNIANSNKVTLELVNPINDTPFATCNYVWAGGTGDISITAAPSITTAPVAQSKCVGQSATFSVAATPGTSGNTLTYQWRKGTTLIPGATNTSVTISPITETDSGYYNVVITESNNSVTTTGNAKLTVLNSPSLTSASNSGPICAGGTLNLSANGASGVTSYAWSGPATITNSATANASVTGATAAASGVYSVSVSNGVCSVVYTTSATVNTNPNVSNFSNPTVGTACTSSGASVTINSTSIASGTYTISYNLSGANASTNNTVNVTVTNPLGGSFTIPAAKLSSTGSTTLTITAIVAGGGCTSTVSTNNTATFTVGTVPSAVSADATPGTLCSGANLTLTSSATGATSYSWAGPGGYTSTAEDPAAFAVTTANAGVYTVTATNSCGSSTATTSAVTVNTTPVSVSANASTSSLCSGANLTLTSSATGATSYSWAGPGGYTSTAEDPAAFAVTTANAGVYTVTATNSCGSTTATTSAVTVNTTPVSVSANASTSSLCSGANLTLTSSATGATSYSWAGPGGYTSTAEDPAAFAVTTANAGVYTVTATNLCGSTTATTSAVTVNTTPVSVSANASTGSLCSGANLTLTSSATGATSYSWAGPGGYTSTAEDPAAFAVTTANAGVYTVTATNSCGSTTATTSTVTVNTTPVSVSASASTSSLCSGANLTLTSSATGATSYSWAGPGGYTSTAEDPAAFAVTTANAGVYTVTVTNSCGSTTATTSAVTVNTTPTSVTANASTGSLCSGANLTLTSSATGATSYSWAGPGGYTSTAANPAAFAVTTANAGVYTITATNSCGSTTATTSIVTVNTTPVSVSASASTSSLCSGANLTLTSSATGATSYSWAGPGGYTSTAEDPAAFAVTTANAGVYTVTATNSCGSTTATTSAVTVNTTPVSVSASASTSSLCSGANLTLTSSATGATSYSWAGPGGYTSTAEDPAAFAVTTANAGVYTVTATNSCGSTTATTSAVTVNITPVSVSANASSSSLCSGANLTLTSSATGATSYSWAGPGGYTSTAEDPAAFAVTTANAGVYTVTATNSCGSTTATTSTVTVNTTPVSVSANASSSSLCSGANLTLTSSATGATSYSWAGPGGYSSTAEDPAAFAVTTANAGVYTVTATNSCGSTTATTSAVTVNTTPVSVSASASTSSLCSGANLTLTSSATGATSYSWAGPGGYSSTAEDPAAFAVTTANAGVYTVTATNSCGSTTATTSAVTVNTTPVSVSASASTSSLCSGANLTLTSSATGATSYSWAGPGGYTSTAEDPAAFAVTTANAGVYTVTVTNSCGSTTATTSAVTVNTTPVSVSASASTGSLCSGSDLTLTSSATGATSYSWAGPGGYTSTAANPAAFAVTTANGGVYTVTATNSCGSTTATTSSVTVRQLPDVSSFSLSAANACSGSEASWTITSSSLQAGSYSYNYSLSGAHSITSGATPSFPGGSITYDMPASETPNTGVYTVTMTSLANNYCSVSLTSGNTATFSILPLPDAGTITGASSVIQGNTITLANTASGGAWSSSNTSVATIGTSGVVLGVLAGTATISYTVTNSCGTDRATAIVTVSSISPIVGASTVLVGNSITLTDATPGGTWSSSNASIASIGTNGVVTAGTTTGVVTITYTVGGAYVTHTVTVEPIQPIVGAATVLVGNSITLTDATPGGTWSSSNASIASIGTNGVVTAGTSTGVVTITYTVGGAYVTHTVTVEPIQPIVGATTVLVGNSISLTDATPGGTWSSSNATIASIGTNGVVTASTTTGVVTITYTVGGAYVTHTVTVEPIQPIVGAATVLVGNSITLTDATSGGTWSSSNASIASIGTNGVVTAGTTTGVVTITYTIGGAYVTHTVTVEPIQPIVGASTVLVGNSITLTDATPGGTWSSSNVSIASIGTNGVVTAGTSTGVVTITYTVGGAYVTHTVTVEPIQPIVGASTVLAGNSITLTDATPGGTWSSSNASIASIGTNGVVTAGTSTGVVTITYTVGGAYVTHTVTVEPIQPIVGAATVLVGNSISLTDATPGGTWSSSNASIASIGTNGVVTAGTSTGVVTITYTVGGAYVTHTVTVEPIQPIVGASTVLVGNSITLTDATPGGTWSSSNASIASIGTNGVITAGTTTGVVTITYTVGGAYVTHTVTVEPIQPIVGASSVLVGNSITLTDATPGGTWSSSNAGIASIGTNGVVTAGTSTGVVTITYTVGGAYVTHTVTVEPIQPIVGASTVLVGNSISLTDATPGGTWSSSNSTIASIGTNGVVTAGTTTGVVTITYTVGGAYVTHTVTVEPIQPIVGASTVLAGNSITLTDATPGGTWSSSNASIASIGTNGVVTAGTTTGVVTITYTVGGAYVTHTVTVEPIQPIVGAATVLVGNSITLTDATSGGTWSSSNASIASIGTNGVVSAGTTTGVVTITYTVGGAYVTHTLTVEPIQPIVGASTVLVGNSITLTDATPGGTWSSSNASIASIGTNGVVTAGTSTGVVTITYTVGGAYVTHAVTVEPIQPIVGASVVLVGNSITLTDATPGGTWSSSNASIASIGTNGVVTAGTSTGVVTITYTVGGAYVTHTVTVEPIQPIVGASTVLAGNSITLTDATPGGTWSSSNSSIASIGTNGVVTAGTTTGVVTITYTVGGAYVTHTVTVEPIQPIVGASTVLVGNSITLTDATSGGTWSSSNASIASIGTNGVVTAGTTTGVVTITYTVGGAYVTHTVTVEPIQPITGPTEVFVGDQITLADATPGGTWSTSNGTIATIGSTGVVTGLGSGTVTVTYTVGGGFVTYIITVNQLALISGPGSVCLGSSITLTNATAGGTWSSSNTSIASIGSTGVITTTGVGVTTVTYAIAGVYVTQQVSVNTVAAITGTASACVGSATTLSNATTGGTWSGTVASVASVGSASGVITGISAGTTTISYISAQGCVATTVAAINALPSVATITGTASACEGATATLASATADGVWSSSNTAVASISASGVATAHASGTTIVSYTVTNSFGCVTSVTRTFTVNALPAIAAITGSLNACTGSTITLGNSVSGGVWTSSNTSVAAVSASTGILAGLSVGTTTVSYTTTSGAGCVSRVTAVVTVSSASAITGTLNMCTGVGISLSNAETGGTWSSANTSVATIGSASGVVTPVAVGTAVITYTLPTGCYSTAVATVSLSPAAIVGNRDICVGGTSTFSNTIGGGFWSSSNTSVATIDPGGFVTSHIVGTSTITYAMHSGCLATATLSVNAYPAAITGAGMICSGNNITLSNTSTGGTWSSSDVTIATVGSANGVVTSVNVGTATITYTSDKGCSVTTTINNPMNAIVGSRTMCKNLSQVLTMLTSGGTWSISDTAIADITAGGSVTAKSTIGSATITYALPSGCYRTHVIDVVAAPAPISGAAEVCVGQEITLSNATEGGVWRGEPGYSKVDGPSGDGTILGLGAGTATVTYRLSESCYVLHTITVNPLPANIVGASQVCEEGSITLTNPVSGGTWLTSNSSVASVSPSTGEVTGVSGGTVTISYMLATGCARTKTVTVNSKPPAITGNRYTCVGSSTMLSNASGSPLSWTSSNTSIAEVSSTGQVYGIGAGSATITFTTGPLCTTTAVVTVQALPAAISGAGSVCPGASTVFSSTDLGGTWSSSNTAVATVGSLTGSITGVAPGVATITYTYGSLGCIRTKTITVLSIPTPISGVTDVCVGATTTLNNSGSGGTWSSSDVSVATIGSSNRVVTGVAAGTATITVINGAGCPATTTVTVQASPAAITGTATTSVGSTTTLSSTSAGTWSSGNTSVATISASGVVTGITGGVSTITFTASSGCFAIRQVTVSAINPISGPTSICEDGSATLTCGTSGGSWSSADASVATIGSSTGLVTAVSVGTAVISYVTPTGAFRTTVLTVNPAIAAITGNAPICYGSTLSLSHALTGGTWTSNATYAATVGMTTGVVSGAASGGTATIRYTASPGCSSSVVVTINTVPAAISGGLAFCEGAVSYFNNAITGGTWSMSDASVATINSTTGAATAVAPGTATVTYTLPSGCSRTADITINALPAAISGPSEVCVGASISLTNATPGGTWSNGDPVHAMGPSTDGVIFGTSVGTTVITYRSSNGCSSKKTLTINPLPSSITGPNTICPGLTGTLSSFTAGGTWSSDGGSAGVAAINPATGVVTAIAAGTAMIAYTIDHGCFVTRGVTVNPTASGITGTLMICAGQSTLLSSSMSGVSWSSSNMAVATVNSSGYVYGVAPGTATITYTVSGGCQATAVVTVNGIPTAIGGSLKTCVGASTTLTNTVAGGVWTSSNTSIATIDPSSGVATGVASGYATITYTAGAGCVRTGFLTVNALPGAISGSSRACIGTSTVFTCGSGTWSSSTPAVATAALSGGSITGISAGTSTITFTATLTGCTSTKVVTVIPVPAASTGTTAICVGQTATLSNSTAGGTWSSSNAAGATVGSASGIVTGISFSTVTITYAINSTCRATTSFTTRALPNTITGSTSVCRPMVTSLSCLSSGGTWSSSNTAIATVGSAGSATTGAVTGLANGTATISYTLSTGCARSVVVTVATGGNPGTIASSTGTFTLRLTSVPSITLSSTGDAGGTWSSSNPAVATINPSTGVMNAVAAGSTNITYTLNTGCTNFVTRGVNVVTGRDGGNQFSAPAEIRLYPNPTSGSFALVSDEAGELYMFSLDGKEVGRMAVSEGTNALQMPAGLATGVYMCRFISNIGNATMIRLVYEP